LTFGIPLHLNAIRRCEEAIDIVLRRMEADVIVFVPGWHLIAVGDEEFMAPSRERMVSRIDRDTETPFAPCYSIGWNYLAIAPDHRSLATSHRV
jgi:hypothetical protein